MSKPKVSVVIGTYNKQRYIEQTLQSVLDQTFTDFELLVIDDCSIDDTAATVQRVDDSRLHFRFRDSNSGCPAIPRNEGMAAARGTYIAFLDADDLWHPRKLERQVAFMDAHPEIPFSHTYCEVIDADGEVQRTRHQGAIPATGRVFLPMLDHCYVTTSTVMLRKDFFDSFGGMLESPEWRTGEDYEYYLRVAARHDIGFIDDVLASYRSQEENQSVSQESTNWRGIPEHVPTLIHLKNSPEIWEGVVDGHVVSLALVRACLDNAWFWKARSQPSKARWFLHKALSLEPFSIRLWKRYIGTLFPAAK